MTPDELRAIGDDFATAIKARGQALADVARQSGSRQGGDLIQQIYNDAADVVSLRATMRAIEIGLNASVRP